MKSIATRVALSALILAPVSMLAACATDDAPGHTKTVTKETVNTPNGKQTVTTTHEKDTTITPR